MAKINVRRKRARILADLLAGKTMIESGNLRFHVVMESWCTRVEVFYRYNPELPPIAWVGLHGSGDQWLEVLDNPMHPHADTAATRNQIKQLRVSAEELKAAIRKLPEAYEVAELHTEFYFPDAAPATKPVGDTDAAPATGQVGAT